MRRDRDAADSQRGTCTVHRSPDDNGERPACGWDTAADGIMGRRRLPCRHAEQCLQLRKVGGCVGARLTRRWRRTGALHRATASRRLVPANLRAVWIIAGTCRSRTSSSALVHSHFHSPTKPRNQRATQTKLGRLRKFGWSKVEKRNWYAKKKVIIKLLISQHDDGS